MIPALLRPRPLALFAAAFAVSAGCAPVTPPPVGAVAGAGGQCFFASTITGFKLSGAALVNVRSSVAGVYQVELASPCGDLRAAEKVLLDSRASGTRVCPGSDVTLIASSPAGSRTCAARGLRKLAEAHVAALPAAERP